MRGREIHPHRGAEWLPPWEEKRYTLIREQVAAIINKKEIHLMGEQSAAIIRERYISWESR
jgi:hypothetical protein